MARLLHRISGRERPAGLVQRGARMDINGVRGSLAECEREVGQRGGYTSRYRWLQANAIVHRVPQTLFAMFHLGHRNNTGRGWGGWAGRGNLLERWQRERAGAGG